MRSVLEESAEELTPGRENKLVVDANKLVADVDAENPGTKLLNKLDVEFEALIVGWSLHDACDACILRDETDWSRRRRLRTSPAASVSGHLEPLPCQVLDNEIGGRVTGCFPFRTFARALAS